MKIRYEEVYSAYMDMCIYTEELMRMGRNISKKEWDGAIRRQEKYELVYNNIYRVLGSPSLHNLMRAVRKFDQKNNYENCFDFEKNYAAIERYLEQ